MLWQHVICLSFLDVCLCSAWFHLWVWLANGVVPCCRLCRLGYCRVTQTGRSAEGSVHWGLYSWLGIFGYILCYVLLYSAVVQTFQTYLIISFMFCFNLLVPCCKIQWNCCQARAGIHCEIPSQYRLESLGFGVLQSGIRAQVDNNGTSNLQ